MCLFILNWILFKFNIEESKPHHQRIHIKHIYKILLDKEINSFKYPIHKQVARLKASVFYPLPFNPSYLRLQKGRNRSQIFKFAYVESTSTTNLLLFILDKALFNF